MKQVLIFWTLLIFSFGNILAQEELVLNLTGNQIGHIKEIRTNLNHQRTDLKFEIQSQGRFLEIQQGQDQQFRFILEDSDGSLVLMKNISHAYGKIDLQTLRQDIRTIRILDLQGQEKYRFERHIDEEASLIL